jgi:hypothetical protein
MASTPESEKTERIGWLCVTMVILGILFMLSKANACALACNSCNQHESSPAVCKDEFFEMGTDTRYSNTHTCTPGARVEVVTSPPAPKPGILCHCINTNQAAPATSASAK